MKNAKDIINLLQNKPQFSKLAKHKCISTIQSLFSPLLQKMIKFAYVKNNTLFFVLTHPGAKQEFDNNIQSIKSALNFYTPDECSEVNITDIKAFVTHTPPTQVVFTLKKPQLYRERAKGNFLIPTDDAKLKALMQSIQEIVKKSNSDT